MTHTLFKIVLEKHRPPTNCVTISKLLNPSEPCMGIRSASPIVLRLITGKYIYTYLVLHGFLTPIISILKSTVLCPAVPSIFSSGDVFHSSHLLESYPLFKIQIKFPEYGKPANPASLANTAPVSTWNSADEPSHDTEYLPVFCGCHFLSPQT